MIIDGYSAEDINNNAMNQYILKRNSELIDRKEFDSYSLTTKLSALRYKGIITNNDYKRLRGALNLEKAIKDIKTEIKERIAYWDKRKPDMNETKIDYTRISENSVPIRNPREIEYIRYDNRADGLEEALDIIDKHIGCEE